MAVVIIGGIVKGEVLGTYAPPASIDWPRVPTFLYGAPAIHKTSVQVTEVCYSSAGEIENEQVQHNASYSAQVACQGNVPPRLSIYVTNCLVLSFPQDDYQFIGDNAIYSWKRDSEVRRCYDFCGDLEKIIHKRTRFTHRAGSRLHSAVAFLRTIQQRVCQIEKKKAACKKKRVASINSSTGLETHLAQML